MDILISLTHFKEVGVLAFAINKVFLVNFNSICKYLLLSFECILYL